MRWLLLGTLAVVGWSVPASAQVAGPAGPAPAPNSYNRQTQPLSPYLNLLRGGNNAVNYFYGVRPGTGAGVQGATNQISAGPRQTFFPVVDTLADLLSEESRTAPRFPSTGHPVGFNNTLNYFGQSPRAARLGQPQQPRR